MTYLELICVMAQQGIEHPIYAISYRPKKGNLRRWWLCPKHLRWFLADSKRRDKLGYADAVAVERDTDIAKVACAIGRLIDVRKKGHVNCRNC